MPTKSILLIDDEPNLAQVIAVCLESFKGWKVQIANSGKAGLSIVESLKPDAILLDVMMPEMDGITVFQHLQQNPETQNIPVILLTAKVQASDRARFAQLDIAGAISKPFEPLQIADQIAQLLNW
ncbi:MULTISPECIES: response regulator [Pseudanabaena]|uniref:response regulator n=1 Tax=Pseudanabaena TaxID=1152 RepID=UPI00247950B1|nr:MULTISPECIES: response regulator [Pseudanabaena]MEA5486018.1 response regulator [Pseudanabaena sp. CCNP1317]WGS73019.1 response regulator [Pseudanabaena galeata CCNP1313]